MAEGAHGRLMSNLDDEDLIGEAPPPKPKRGRPSNEEVADRDRRRREALEQDLRSSQLVRQGKSALGDPYAVQAGVNVTWLMQAFRQDIKTVRRKLANLEPLGIGPRNVPVYDFAKAASYLAKPPPNQLAEFLNGLRVQDLPIHLQEPYWGAMRKRQIWMEKAGQLWPTDAVLEVFGDAFKTIKNAMQLWVDSLESQEGLTDEQRVLVGKLVDGLQEELFAKLVEMPKLKQTGSMATSPEANPTPPDPEVFDEDDDAEDLVG